MSIFKFFLSLFKRAAPSLPVLPLTAEQRREQFCSKGQHDYNSESHQWWMDNGQAENDDADTLTFSGRHCKDCGHWDTQE